jgi:predicted short-subunit dehydrogenase-like oxidoreductase (DUF2520 family)
MMSSLLLPIKLNGIPASMWSIAAALILWTFSSPRGSWGRRLAPFTRSRPSPIQKAIENLPGSTFALEAEGGLLGILKEMASALEGRWIKLGPGDKAAYHAAAVMTSNYLVTLVKLATDLWESFGIPREQATQALLPLLKGTVSNIENLGIPKALTGPIARGDAGTVQIHLKALQETAPAIIPSYCELGLQTIPVALAKGKINNDQAEELETMLRQR